MSDELCCGYSDKGHMKWCDEGRDRHPKWQRVEPGTVIPAGQPYRVEYPEMLPECLASDTHGILAVDYDGLNLPFKPFQRSNFVETSRWFVDSSWKPPLELPTEPTWGIAVNKIAGASFGRWMAENSKSIYDDHNQRSLTQGLTTDFIPLTDEQVARIEAAR